MPTIGKSIQGLVFFRVLQIKDVFFVENDTADDRPFSFELSGRRNVGLSLLGLRRGLLAFCICFAGSRTDD